MSSEPPPRFSSSGITSRPRSGLILVARPVSGTFSSRCTRLGQRLIGLAPLRQADLLDVRVHRLGDRLVHVPRPRRAEHAASCTSVSVIIVARLAPSLSPMSHSSLMCVVVGLAEVVPDRRVRRHDVRLIAAVGDHVVRALLQAQVLAAEVPADVHQLDGVERRAAAPRRAGGVRALALERVLDRDQAVAAAVAPADAAGSRRRARRCRRRRP